MKTKLFIPVLIVVCFACGKNNGTLTLSQKEKVISEVKPVVNDIIKGAENANFEMISGSTFDSPDYTYINGGKVYSYKDIMEGFKPVFASMSNQKMTIASEKYAVLDKTTVLYTLTAKWEMNFKDGHSVIQAPWVNQFTFKKMDGKWKVVNVIESGYEKAGKVSTVPKELNQVELAKQLLGNWKCEFNDTVVIYSQKPYGTTGQQAVYKLSTKGKLVDEGIQGMIYDRQNDRMIVTNSAKNLNSWVASLQFTSKDKYVFVFGADMYHPESAAFRIEGELSQDKLIEKYFLDGKPTLTYTYTKIR